MINVAEITEKMKILIEESPDLSDIKAVERGEYVNRDTGRTPWVGVYRSDIRYTPRALGNHSKSWDAEITIKLVVQTFGSDGEDAEDSLEDVLQRVMSVIFGNLSIDGVVMTLRSVNVQYSYEETESETMQFQWAFVTLIYQARTGA